MIKETSSQVQVPANDKLPSFASANLRQAYELAQETCSNNAELTLVHDMIPSSLTNFRFTCNTTRRIALTYSFGGNLQGKAALLPASTTEQPIPLEKWNISADDATTAALAGGGAAFLSANLDVHLFSRILEVSQTHSQGSARAIAWDVQFASADFAKQRHFYVDATTGAMLQE